MFVAVKDDSVVAASALEELIRRLEGMGEDSGSVYIALHSRDVAFIL